MSKLPIISGQECIKALGKADFYILRQRGSHIILRRNEPFAEVVVPNHQELDKGTLRAIIRQVGLSVDEFIPFETNPDTYRFLVGAQHCSLVST
ncbi:type II toxin-antitoxin system HicA family toxin [Nostoc sp.]